MDGSGRIAVQEILLGGHNVAACIRESKTAMIPSIIQAGMREGMQSMDAALERLVKEGVVSPRDALEKALDKESFARIPAVAKELGTAALA
jgi:twitching motility protein PilT